VPVQWQQDKTVEDKCGYTKDKDKGKGFPLQARCGPEGG